MANNPDEYGEIIEENFAISYESGSLIREFYVGTDIGYGRRKVR